MNAPQTYTKAQRILIEGMHDTGKELVALLNIERHREGDYPVVNFVRMFGMIARIHSDLNMVAIDMLLEQLPTAGESATAASRPAVYAGNGAGPSHSRGTDLFGRFSGR